LTPHPGEMARLLQLPVARKSRIVSPTARQFAIDRNVCLVLKGFARHDCAAGWYRVFIIHRSPAFGKAAPATFSPGLTAGLIAQFPRRSA